MGTLLPIGPPTPTPFTPIASRIGSARWRGWIKYCRERNAHKCALARPTSLAIRPLVIHFFYASNRHLRDAPSRRLRRLQLIVRMVGMLHGSPPSCTVHVLYGRCVAQTADDRDLAPRLQPSVQGTPPNPRVNRSSPEHSMSRNKFHDTTGLPASAGGVSAGGGRVHVDGTPTGTSASPGGVRRVASQVPGVL